MKLRRIYLVPIALGMILVAGVDRVQADLILSIESREFAENSGVQTLKVFARSDAADQITSLAADFTLS